MPGTTRIAWTVAASMALHALLLAAAPERPRFAPTPRGEAGTVAVRLVPGDASRPDPAAQAGVAGSVPRARRETPDETATARAGSISRTADAPAYDGMPATARAEPAPTAPARIVTREPATAPSEPSSSEPPPKGASPSGASADGAASGERTAATELPAQTPQAAPDAEGRTVRTDPDPGGPAARRAATAEPGARASPAGAGSTGAEAELARRARQQVTTELRRHFRYPRLARRRGWEGEVVLAFRVRADGSIDDIEVARSSGRELLDRAAIESLRLVERIPEFSPLPGAGMLELELPVTYRLQPAA